MSFGTLRQRIVQEVHRASSQDQSAVDIAIITAMQWFKPYHFFFNEATHTFTLTSGQEEYPEETATTEGWPSDLVAPITLYVKSGGTRWLKLHQISIDRQRWLQPTDFVVGVPTHWSWHDEKIYLTPKPTTTSDEIRMDYVKDVGIPTYEWDGTAWAFKTPAGSILPDTYTNRWIEDAELLIRQRAKLDLYFNYYDDDSNAQKMDIAVATALSNLRQRSNQYKRLIPRRATRI